MKEERTLVLFCPHAVTMTPDGRVVFRESDLVDPNEAGELRPDHLAFIDFLVKRALEEWERSKDK